MIAQIIKLIITFIISKKYLDWLVYRRYNSITNRLFQENFHLFHPLLINPLQNSVASCIIIFVSGGMAQLGARLNGIQKVRGSNPLISIVENSWFYREFFYLLWRCFGTQKTPQAKCLRCFCVKNYSAAWPLVIGSTAPSK